IVPRHLAVIQGDSKARVVVLHADHCQMVKYTRDNDVNYRKVADYLAELVGEATVAVEENWIRENGYRGIAKGESAPTFQTVLPKPRIPVSRNYVHRPYIYDFITEKLLPLAPPEHQPRCILHGLGGAGKTQAGTFWIEQNKDKFSRIVVVDASNQQQIEADLETAIRSIGPQFSKATWKDAVAYLSDEKGWLLFLDNADQPGLRLDEYLPNSIHGAILVTTRNRDCILYAPDSHIQVEKMTEKEAVDLLHKVANVTPLSIDASIAIVREVGLWALAITQAGAYIFRTKSLNTYLATFQKHRDKLMREAVPAGRSGQLSAYTAFDLSFELLPKEAQELMKICAFLHHSSIPHALFEKSTVSGFRGYYVPQRATGGANDSVSDSASGGETSHQMEFRQFLKNNEAIVSSLEGILGSKWDNFSFQMLIDSIARGSLIDTTTESDGQRFYGIHPLVQTYIRDLLGKEDRESYALLAGQLLLGAIEPLSKGENNTWHRQIMPHIDHLPAEVKMAYIFHSLSFLIVYKSTGSWNAGQPLSEYCYSQLCEVLGAQHPITLRMMEDLSKTLHFGGRLEQAEKLRREVCSLQAKILGPQDPHTMAVMSGLANTLHECGQVREAEKIRRKVLALQMKNLGPRRTSTVVAMNNVAHTLYERGQLAEAEKIQRKGLRLLKETLGPHHKSTVVAMGNLADTLQDRGKLEEAEQMQKEVLALRTEALGRNHPDTLLAMGNFALTLRACGRLTEAEKMGREVLALRREILGERHPDTVL
ncbi:hypothetical protein FRC16_005900, partial [Serendipita sp. 398]